MARNKKTSAPAARPDFNEEALKAAGAAIDARATQLAPIDAKFGGVAPYQKDLVIEQATFFINQGSESFFEAGKRLLLLKEHEEHGEFTKALDRIGIDDRAARKLMTVAARFADSKALSVLPRSKLLELAMLDDEDLAELDKGGTAAGLTFDDVDKMGVRELRQALRKEREQRAEDNESNERLIASKDKKLNALSKRSYEPWDERMAGLVDELHTCSLGASEVLTRVFQVAEAAAVFKIDHDDEMHQKVELAVRMINDVNLLVQRVAAIQGFIYEHFMEFTEGAVPVLTEPVEPGKKSRG
jgi:hypothetical protein